MRPSTSCKVCYDTQCMAVLAARCPRAETADTQDKQLLGKHASSLHQTAFGPQDT